MKRKGISLIVLVITIILIIILATAIIVNIANTNIIGNANAAVFKSDISTMQDELTMYISNKYTESLGEYESKKLQATEEGVWYGSTQQEGTIIDILKSMDEKYIGKLFIQDGKLVANKMTITVEEEKWLNDIGIESGYQTDIGKIEIVPSITEWIKGNVDLEINYTKEIPEGYVIEYKINAGKWQEGTQVTVEENNTIVTARLYSKEKDNEALSNSYEVSNIDKENPTAPTNIEITVGINSVTAVASGATDTLSGIEKYQYSIDNLTWQDSGTFNGYKNATEVTVYAKVIDKVGNESTSISDKGTTTEVSAPTVNLVNTEWTKDDIIASVTGTAPEGYVLQYKLSGGMTKTWTTYTGAVTITTNNTTMVARYYNEDVEDEIDSTPKTASKIDKFAPDITNMKISITAGTNNVTATASGATDSLSGNVTYKYSIDNSTWQTSGTFSGYKSSTEVTVYAKAIDKVGNESASASNKGTTSSLGQVGITVTQNPAPTTATNNFVNGSTATTKVTLTHATVSGYTLQYKLSGGMTKDWTTYSGEISITANNTTVATRMYNSTLADEGNSANSKTISNIDLSNPTQPTSVTLTATTNSVTATATGSTDVGSGLLKYQYSKDNSTWQNSGTFSGIKSGTAVTIYARAVDKVGRVSTSISNKGTTNSISAVEIIQNPVAKKSDGTTNWTKGDVTVTLSHAAVTGYTLQYKIGSNGTWTKYSSALTITSNSTTIYTRMYNSTVKDEAGSNTLTVSNIDKGVPATPTTLTFTTTESSITATADGSTDSLSGLSKYQYSKDNSTWQDSGTFTGLTEGTKYTIYTRAVDKVGNVSTVKSATVNTVDLYTATDVSNSASTFYGKSVTNYTATNSAAAGWKIFHSDGTYIYLIADNYISSSYVPKGKSGTTLPTVDTSSYKFSFANIYANYTGSTDIKGSRTNSKVLSWMNFVSSYPSSTNENVRSSAYLLDTTAWANFAGTNAEYAIGAPTLELFAASYNKINSTKLNYSVANKYGYYVKLSTGSTYAKNVSGLGNSNTMYFISSTTRALGMWLASPCGNWSDCVLGVWYSDNGYIGPLIYTGNGGLGLRPVVCLKSTVKLKASDTGYVIAK